MSEKKEIIPVEDFPHNVWLSENVEFLADHPLSKEIKKEIGGFAFMYYNNYKNATEKTIEKRLDSAMKRSILLADMLQTFKEIDLEDEPALPDKAESEEAERVAVAQIKEEGGTGGWGWVAAIFGIGAAIFLGVKYSKK